MNLYRRFRKWWRRFLWLGIETWRWGPLHIVFLWGLSNGNRSVLYGIDNYDSITDGPYLIFDIGKLYLSLAWEPRWNEPRGDETNVPY